MSQGSDDGGRPAQGPAHGGGAPGPPQRRPDDDALKRLTERAAVIIGIATGILGVLLAVGFVFLPASTLPEKAYVLFACLALSVAAVTGIGAWESPRRFGVTAASGCVAIVCLAALSITAQGDHRASASAASNTQPINTSSSEQPSAPTTHTSASSVPSSPVQSHAATPSTSAAASTPPAATATVTGCGSNSEHPAYADLAITNHTSGKHKFFVDVGLYQGGTHYLDASGEPTISAGATYEDALYAYVPPPGPGPVSCKVVELFLEDP